MKRIIVVFLALFVFAFGFTNLADASDSSTNVDYEHSEYMKNQKWISLHVWCKDILPTQYPADFDKYSNPASSESRLTGEYAVDLIGQNASKEYYYRLGHNKYILASEVIPLYGAHWPFNIDITTANDLYDASTNTEYIPKTYKLQGEVIGASEAITLNKISVVVEDSSHNKVINTSVELNETSNYTITPNSSIASKVDFNKLTVGERYKITVTANFTDHFSPVSKTVIEDHVFPITESFNIIILSGDTAEEVTARISDVRAPSGTLNYGNKFTLKGKITAFGAKLSEVGARVYAADDTSYRNPLTGKVVSTTTASYSIEGSTLDTNCKFASLEPGSYVYRITAKAGGKNFEVYRSTFKISSPTYTVSYDGNGYWNGIPGQQTKKYNVNLKLSSIVPSREGYDFLGWATSKTASTAAYQPGGSYKANKDVKLYAVWQKRITTIRLRANDTTHYSEDIQIDTGDSYQFREIEYNKPGYDFIGWTRTDGSEVPDFRIGDYYSGEDDIMLYGVYRLKNFQYSFDANGGTEAPEPVYRNYGNVLVMPAGVPTREGFVFDGWGLSPTGSGGFSANEIVTWIPDEDSTFYAHWRTNEQGVTKITRHLLRWPDAAAGGYHAYGFYSDEIDTLRTQFDLDGAPYEVSSAVDGKSLSTDITGKTIRELGWSDFLEIDDSSFHDLEGGPVRITGWSTAEHGNGTRITEDTVLTGGNIDIYPIFMSNGVYVDFDANGGSGEPKSFLRTRGRSYTIPNDIPILSGFQFDGWARDPQATAAEKFPGETCSYIGNADDCWNLTFYAVWKNAFSVNYQDSWNKKLYYSNGVFEVPEEVPTKTFTPTVGEPVNYTFVGWSTSRDAVQAEFLPGQTYQLNANITVYPVWRADFACLRMHVYQDPLDLNGFTPFAQYSGKHSLRNYPRIYSFAAELRGKSIEELGWTLFDEHDFPGTVYAPNSSCNQDGRIQGWYTGENGTGEHLVNGTIIYGIVDAYPYDVCPDIRIKYAANGGLGVPEPVFISSGGSTSVTAAEPIREGYDFLGWSTNRDASEAEYHAGDAIGPTSDLLLYAVWQKNTHAHIAATRLDTSTPPTCTHEGNVNKVIYCTDCGEVISSEEEVVPKTEHQPTEPVKENLSAPTEDVSGHFDEVVYCEVCQEEISRETVTIPRKVEFENIEINIILNESSGQTLVVKDGDTGELFMYPELLRWYSSDDSIATVNEKGMLNAVNTGVAVIWAETQAGYYTACLVRVYGASPSEGDNSGFVNGLYWEIVDNNLLNISGSGTIPDFEGLTAAPWASFARSITRVRMESGITAIGDYAFVGFGQDHPFRIEFNQVTLPPIATRAFTGSNAICRYYSEDESYNEAGQYGGELEWVYLPIDNQEGVPLALNYHSPYSTNPTGWTVYYEQEAVTVDILQAKELSYRGREIIFYDIPTSEEDLSIFEDRLDPDCGLNLDFAQECEGYFTLTLSDASRLAGIDMDAPGLTLTVIDPREDGMGRLLISNGTVIYNGSMLDAYLWNSNSNMESSPPSITVNGNVEHLNFYGPTSDSPYTGNLTVNGTIAVGTVYGAGIIAVPGVSDNVPVQDAAVITMTNVNQTAPVVRNGELNVQEGVVPVGNLDISMFRPEYQLYSHGWYLVLHPRDISGGYSVRIDNVLEFNPEFTADDIIWGDDTELVIYEPGEYDHIVVNGGTDSEGHPVGLGQVRPVGCDLTINCPVDWLILRHEPETSDVTSVKITAPVRDIWLNIMSSGDVVELGEGGSIQTGQWDRVFMNYRNFGPVNGPRDIYRNDKVCVLNWKDGDLTQVIIPSEAEITTAAGLDEGQVAMMDVSDSSLKQEEQTALEQYLTEANLSLDAVSSVFDASVSSFSVDENGDLTFLGSVIELDAPVDMSVKNTAEGESVVVRLHEKNGTVEASAVSELTTDEVIDFASDLFSKYAIVSNVPTYEWAADNATITARRISKVFPTVKMETETVAVTYEIISSPTQINPGTVFYTSAGFENPAFVVQTKEVTIPSLNNMQVLILPDMLTAIEEEAFMGGAFEAVIVPANCTSVGIRAFADCESLKYISVPGPETTMSETAFQGCGPVIVDRTPIN